MSYNPETWTISSNDALKLSIVDTNGTFEFRPIFTYPIFGDAEQIFGYKDLQINLIFESTTFLPLLQIQYSEKLNDTVEDIQAKLLEFLPESTVINDEKEWLARVTKEKEEAPKDFTEKFQLITEYSENNEKFQVFRSSFSNQKIVELNERLQILVLLYIEAGSYIDASDEVWDLFFIVDSKKNIIGFATTYSYFKYDGAKDFDVANDIKKRNKISQFIVLPPYQKNKHGSNLYKSIFDFWSKDSNIEEITVEDPNEKFDDLRYINDFKRLYEVGLINELPKNLSLIDNKWFKIQAKSQKIELNQFKKLIEIGYLYQNNIKFARLLIKKRLYDKNRDGLLELDIPVRNDKLQTAYERIKQDYEKLIDLIKNKDEDEDGHISKKQKI